MDGVSKTIFVTFTLAVLFLMYLLQPNKQVIRDHLPHNQTDHRIPSIVHFVVGQTDDKKVQHRFQSSTSFSFVNYLTFLAARRHLQPDQLFVHYYEEPNTFWWNMTKHDPEIDLTLMPTRLVDTIFDQPVSYHTHRSDILRHEVLLEYGGIYLDTDVLILRSFHPLLGRDGVVMAYEDSTRQLIGSAVIMASRDAPFLRRIYDSYQNYNRTCYRCNAIEVPAKLASIYPREVKVLSARNFFVPGWNAASKFFDSNDYNFTANYASHLWNSFNHARLSALSPDVILQGNFTLARMFLQAIGKSAIEKLRKIFQEQSKS